MSKNMLGVALRDLRGPLNTLMERLSGEDGDLVLKELNKFNRGEPCMINGLPYTKLIWSDCLGEIRNIGHLGDRTDDYRTMHGRGWRLPTVNELSRYLRSLEREELERQNRSDYYVAVLIDNTIFPCIYCHDGRGNLGRRESFEAYVKPYMILCCECGVESSK